MHLTDFAIYQNPDALKTEIFIFVRQDNNLAVCNIPTRVNTNENMLSKWLKQILNAADSVQTVKASP